MTQIKSLNTGEPALEIVRYTEEKTVVAFGSAQSCYRHGELLDALGAVRSEYFDWQVREKSKALNRMHAAEEKLAEAERAASEADAKLAEAKASIDNWRQEVGIVTRERDALAATVERVREVERELRRVQGTSASPVRRVLDKFRAALDPKPALPTEPGEWGIATGKTDRETRFTDELCCTLHGGGIRVVGNKGEWIGVANTEDITAWKPAKVVAE